MKSYFRFFLISFFVMSKINFGIAEPYSNRLDYYGYYNFHHMHCNFKVNGLTVYTTLGTQPRDKSVLAESLGAFLAEGNNIIGIQAMDIPEDPTDAHCEITLSILSRDFNSESNVSDVFSLRVAFDENGDFTARENQIFEDELRAGNDIQLMDTGRPSFKNQDMRNDVLVTRVLNVTHPHKYFSWTYRATSFEDTIENRQLLWGKYEELRAIIENKDLTGYKQFIKPGYSEMGDYMNLGPESVDYAGAPIKGIQKMWDTESFEILPYNQEDYQLLISEDKKLFRFISKSDLAQRASPLRIKSEGGNNPVSLNFTFTLIDGDIVVAF